jgi:hypothetical protein
MGVMLWHVEAVCKNGEDFEQVRTSDASNPDTQTSFMAWQADMTSPLSSFVNQ